MSPKAPDAFLTAPDLGECSHDMQDVLMHDVVSCDPLDYGLATHILVGCPQDIGVRRNGGRPGAALSPATVRRYFYKLKPAAVTSGIRLLDLGDVPASDDLEGMHETLFTVVEQAVRHEKKVLVLGGGNDISFPDARAVSAVHPGFSALNMDAHLDMRQSDVVHSGTPYRNLVDGHFLNPEDFHEVGIQPWANSPKYIADVESMGVHIHTLHTIQKMGLNTFFDNLFHQLDGRTLFVGLDMDSVRASDAPGVSAPGAVGFTADDILNFADRCRDHGETAVFEITEVNPRVDVDDRTSRLAALALYTFLYGLR